MSDSELLQIISARPDLPQLAAAINEKLAIEAKAREEFRRNLTASIKAEFIAGTVVMHSPAKARYLKATGRMYALLHTYVASTGLGQVFTEKALITLSRNDYEPDIVFFNRRKAAAFTDEQMEFPAPDFIVEFLSPSTEGNDRGVKFDDYALHDVREYWIVDCEEQTVEQYLLRDGETKYHLYQKLHSGSLQAQTISGFTLPIAAIFDDRANMEALRNLLAP